MKIRCPECGASGNVDERLIPDGGRFVRCPRCKNRFMVERGLEGEGRDAPYYSPRDPFYHPLDGYDPMSEEDLFLFWWFFFGCFFWFSWLFFWWFFFRRFFFMLKFLF